MNAFVLIPPEGFASEYFTELYVKGPDYPLYSEDYDAWIETLRERVETAADGSVQARYDRLVREGEEKIADGERELADQRAEGEAELADARQELAELEPPELYLLDRSESNAGCPSRATPTSWSGCPAFSRSSSSPLPLWSAPPP